MLKEPTSLYYIANDNVNAFLKGSLSTLTLLPYYLTGTIISAKSIDNYVLFTTDSITEVLLYSVSTLTNELAFMVNSK